MRWAKGMVISRGSEIATPGAIAAYRGSAAAGSSRPPWEGPLAARRRFAQAMSLLSLLVKVRAEAASFAFVIAFFRAQNEIAGRVDGTSPISANVCDLIATGRQVEITSKKTLYRSRLELTPKAHRMRHC